jgi:bifunctional enzyme CysN/CysC
LAIGSVIYGVSGDLAERPSEENHPEQIRRLAEVAHILLEAGLILIVTAIELRQEDLDLIKTVVDGGSVETVWVGEPVTTDVSYDLLVPGSDQVNTSVSQIIGRLQDQGYIFTP